jgi:hypothetical protein
VRGERPSVQVCGCPQVGSNGYRCLFCTSLSVSLTHSPSLCHRQSTEHKQSLHNNNNGGVAKGGHNTPQRALQPWVLGSKAGLRHVSAPWRVATVISSARVTEVCSRQTKGNQSLKQTRKQTRRGNRDPFARRCSEVKQINKCCASQIGQLKHGLA